MSMQRPLEGLLRPPVEWHTTYIACIVAFFLMVKQNWFLLPPFICQYTAIGLLVLATLRFKQGYRVWRYTRNLKRMPKYSMKSSELPVSNHQLFLGLGFLWTPIHTQRRRDLDLDYNLHYRYPSHFYNWARNIEFVWEKRPFLKHIAKLTKKDSLLNPVRPYPEIGGEPCIHGVSETERAVTLKLAERNGHVIVIGTTRVGKTRLAELLIAQDIHRGDVTIVLDPKGDADLLKRIYKESILAGRLDDLLVFHLSHPEFSCRYNPIGNFTHPSDASTRITNGLPTSGNSSVFKDFAWQYVDLVIKTLVEMGVRPTYKLVAFYITKLDLLLERYCEEKISKMDVNYEKWVQKYIASNTKRSNEGELIKPTRKKAILEYAKNYTEEKNRDSFANIQNSLLTDLAFASRLDKTYYDKITASVGPLLKKLTSGSIADLLSPNYEDADDKRPILDWMNVLRSKKIVYIGMAGLKNSEICSVVGNAMLSDLVSVAGHLYDFGLDHGFDEIIEEKTPLPRICLHSDEFNEVIGDEFVPLLNKAGGAGFNVTAYTQTWSDVEARLESQAKAGQVAGNLNTIIMLRTKEAKTVEMLINQLPKIPILRQLPVSSSADSPHSNDGILYQSTNEDRFAHHETTLIDQSDVLNLPKGQAFCLLEGGQLYKVRIPLPADENFDLPPTASKLIQQMRAEQKSDVQYNQSN